MGLLDLFNSAEGQQGLGLLAAAGPRADGAGFGQRLMEGINNGKAMERAQMQQQMQQLQFQSAMRQQAILTKAMEDEQVGGRPTQPGQAPSQFSSTQPGVGGSFPAIGGVQPQSIDQPWSRNKINLYAMSGNPGLQKAAELEQARQLSGQTDIGKLMVQAGIDPNSQLGRQMTQQAIAKSNYQAPTRLGEGAYNDPLTGVQGLPTAAPAGYINKRDPVTGTWSTEQVTGGVDAVQSSSRAHAAGPASVKAIVAYDANNNPIYSNELTASSGGMGAGPQLVAAGRQIPSVGDYQPSAQIMAKIAADAQANGIQNPFANFKGTQAAAQLPAGAPLKAGPSFGASENIKLMQTQGASLLDSAQKDAAPNQQTNAYFDEINNLLDRGARFGPMSADLARWKALVPGVDLSGSMTNQDVMRKLAANLSGARGTRSDADLANWQKAYPNGEMTNQAIKEVLPMLRSTLAVSDARSKVLTSASADGLENLPRISNAFNQIASPSIVAAGKQLADASNSGKTQEFIAQFKAQYPKDWQQRLQTIQQLDKMGAF